MSIIEALTLCRDTGARVRPVWWRIDNPLRWVEFLKHTTLETGVFVEFGSTRDVAHPLRLKHEVDFLGPWEVVETKGGD